MTFILFMRQKVFQIQKGQTVFFSSRKKSAKNQDVGNEMRLP